jgi:hypothetical protein
VIVPFLPLQIAEETHDQVTVVDVWLAVIVAAWALSETIATTATASRTAASSMEEECLGKSTRREENYELG